MPFETRAVRMTLGVHLPRRSTLACFGRGVEGHRHRSNNKKRQEKASLNQCRDAYDDAVYGPL